MPFPPAVSSRLVLTTIRMRPLFLLALSASASLAQAPAMSTSSAPIIIKADRIVDGRGHVIQGGSVVVADGKISRVNTTASAAATYDLKGYTLLPGLIDELKRSGLHFRNQMEVGPGGRQIQLEDPDGNPIELFEPGAR